jgi:predicted N-acetyltransferase YhbS
MIKLTAEQPEDAGPIEAILDAAFGADRQRKRSYHYRTGVETVAGLCLVAHRDDRVLGTIRFWPIAIGNGGRPALLLGPVAVDPAVQARGLGARLIRTGIARAEAAGHRLVILVGDEAYYGRFGFGPAARYGISMPKESQPRVLALTLGDLPESQVPSGPIRKWRAGRRLPELAFAA